MSSAAGLAQDVGFSITSRVCAGFLGVLNACLQMFAQPCPLMMRVERARFSRPFSSTSSCSDWRTAQCKPPRVTDETPRRRTCLRCFRGRRPDDQRRRRSGFVILFRVVQRVAGIALARPEVGVQVESCRRPRSARNREALAFQCRDEFFLRFVLGLLVIAPNRRIVFLRISRCGRAGRRLRCTRIPSRCRRDVLGIELHRVEHDAGGVHHIVADAVTGHPGDSVFSHRKATLSARFQPATPSNLQQFTTKVTERRSRRIK